MVEQLDIFTTTKDEKKLTKPIRLISFFSGIESQLKALKFLSEQTGLPVESYKTCEWAFNSIVACNEIHNKDFTDYSKDLTKEQLIEYLDGNISTDYNVPCEVNKKPLKWLQQCYNSCIANHNLMNIMKVKGKDLEIVDTDKYDYILTYSFPCQDLSLAGKRQGMSVSQANGGTRSGLLWEVERILKELKEDGTLPTILLLENVPQIHSAKNLEDFKKWLKVLDDLGYSSYWKDLNAKKFGIPQNRNRCFVVSILGDYGYEFPQEFPLELRLKDLLEDNVDEKYYLSESMVKFITTENEKHQGSLQMALINKICSQTITTREGCTRPQESNYICNELPENTDIKEVVRLGGLHDKNGKTHQAGSIYDKNGLSPTLDCATGGQRQPYIVVSKNGNKFVTKGTKQLDETIENNEINDGTCLDLYNRSTHEDIAQTIDTGYHNSLRVATEYNLKQEITDIAPTQTAQCGSTTSSATMLITNYTEESLKRKQKNVLPQKETIAPTITANAMQSINHKNCALVPISNLRIRKLTPKECFRLMAFQDKDVDSLSLSNSAIYHCAGDSICVNVIIGLFASLFGVDAESSIKKYIDTIKK